jgi:hypothetical protein
LLYIAASVEQYCDITQVNALPENEGILEAKTTMAGASWMWRKYYIWSAGARPAGSDEAPQRRAELGVFQTL